MLRSTSALEIAEDVRVERAPTAYRQADGYETVGRNRGPDLKARQARP